MPPKTANYEARDVEPWLMACLAAGLAMFVLASPALLLGMYPEALHQSPPRLPATHFPEPRLQVDNASDFIALRSANDARLATFGWVDRERKIVHLPIEQAMSLTVERGLAGWPTQ
jgi:hypothetical protein